MNDDLLAEVLGVLDSSSVGVEVESLVLAAIEGDDALASAIGGAVHPRPAMPPADPVEPAGAYLRSISVEGFRGIGGQTVLELTPGPGLTIVVGRNGSGKSSLAEGFEALLTGSTGRLQRSAVFRDSWRNLHRSAPCRLRAELVVEGQTGGSVIERSWATDAKFEASTCTVQAAGKPRAPMATLGWDAPLATYRPFLSNGEFEAMLNTPSGLHDRLAEVLGLDPFNDAMKRISQSRKALDDVVSLSSKTGKVLATELAESADPRALACAQALATRTPKLGDIEAVLLTGTESGDQGQQTLDRLTALVSPSLETVSAAIEDLRVAADRLDAISPSAGHAAQLSALLLAALDHHQDHGDGPCPVCGGGVLDDAWRSLALASVEQLEADAAEVSGATAAAARARQSTLALVRPVPAELASCSSVGLETEGSAAIAAWTAWASTPRDGDGTEELRSLADHFEEHVLPLNETVDALVQAAASRRDARESAWQPLALRLAAWLPGARKAAVASPTAKLLRQAEDWFKTSSTELRQARLRPIETSAQAVWRKLRQESNISLEGISLSSFSTRRSAEIKVKIDDVDGAALGVMSQGEINALALSLFIPRATLPESPFRFVVIDDPVQAMDPAKVDGLARVFHELAERRQVVVFTHDDRLPSALRRLELAAKIVSVTRQPGSDVAVAEVGSPARQALENAMALRLTDGVPEGVCAGVIPGLCRAALEATFSDMHRRRALAAGAAHEQVETELLAARSLTQYATLGLFSDDSRGGDVLGRLRSFAGRFANVFQQVNHAVHRPGEHDLKLMISDTRDLIDRLATVR